MRTIRLLGFGLHLAAGFAAAALFTVLPQTARQFITKLWSRALLAVLGVRLRVDGDMDSRAALVVANHISWLDIFAIAAIRPCVFVCKSEVADWPAFGWLLKRVGTIFLERGSARAAARTAAEVARHLRSGKRVAVFPEGTSTDGERVLPFSAALFQATIDAGCPIQPLALSYNTHDAVYAGGTAFGASLLAVAGARELQVGVKVLPSLPALDRRDAARRSHELIALSLRSGTFPARSGHELEDGPQGALAAAQDGHSGLV